MVEHRSDRRPPRADDHGRRQLQALVRLRAEDSGSGPTLPWRRPARATGTQIVTNSVLGRMERRSVLTKVTAPRTQRDLRLGSALELSRTGTTYLDLDDRADRVGVHNRSAFVVGCAA